MEKKEKLLKELIILLLILPLNICYGQKLNERDCIKKSHINLKKESIWFIIHGKIEINGHTFINHKRECPIIYKATVKGIAIINTCTNIEYQYRDCRDKNCEILHLIEKQPSVKDEPILYTWPIQPDKIYLDF